MTFDQKERIRSCYNHYNFFHIKPFNIGRFKLYFLIRQINCPRSEIVMKKLILSASLVAICSFAANAQKGIDTQTQKIKEQGQSSSRSTDATRSFDWGKGKTTVRDRLANPYKLNSRRDVLVEAIIGILRDNKIVVDESASRTKDGIIITQPFVFAKGAVITQNELNRYALLQSSYETAWTGGKYTLMIEVQSIDGIQNNVSVTAKVEGKSGNGLGSEWTTLQSSGVAEDDFLVKLVESVTGKSFDGPQDTDQ